MFKNKKQKGFTLLELLVVIGIIGLLASILVINLTSARKRARDTKRIADIRNIQTATEDYYGKNGKYPATIGDLVTGNQLPIWPLDPLAPSGTVLRRQFRSLLLVCYLYANWRFRPPVISLLVPAWKIPRQFAFKSGSRL